MKPIIFVILSLLLTAGCAEPAVPADNSGNTDVPPAASSSQSVSPSSEPLPKEENPMNNMISITVTVGGTTFSAILEDSETSRALAELLPLTLNMSELNGNEKYFYLDQSLPTDSKCPGQIHTGDLMLYGDNCLVLFYESFSSSYSYTRLGSIDDPEGLAQAVGHGNATVTFAVQN